MSKHSRAHSSYQLDIASKDFERAFVMHRNAVTTAVKKTSRTNDCDGREREKILKEDLEGNVKLCPHNRFSKNR